VELKVYLNSKFVQDKRAIIPELEGCGVLLNV